MFRPLASGRRGGAKTASRSRKQGRFGGLFFGIGLFVYSVMFLRRHYSKMDIALQVQLQDASARVARPFRASAAGHG